MILKPVSAEAVKAETQRDVMYERQLRDRLIVSSVMMSIQTETMQKEQVIRAIGWYSKGALPVFL